MGWGESRRRRLASLIHEDKGKALEVDSVLEIMERCRAFCEERLSCNRCVRLTDRNATKEDFGEGADVDCARPCYVGVGVAGEGADV